jgi:Glycosyl hydrolases family 18
MVRSVTRPRRRILAIVASAWIVAGCGTTTPSVAGAPSASPVADLSDAPSASPSAVVTLPPSSAPTPEPSLVGSTLPAHLFAPYLETYSGDRMTDVAAASGQTYFTLAFLETLTPTSCDLVWNGATTLDTVDAKQMATDAAALRAKGGDAIPSFGGYSADHAGREIGDSCADPAAIATAYEHVIDLMGASRLDLDIEDESLGKVDAIDRRNAALRMLQDRLAAKGRSVQIQYTLPTSPNGLDDDGLAVLKSAVAHGTRVDVVNIMVFDYYDGTTTDMAAAAIKAATSLRDQLTTLYPDKTDAERWAMIGMTIMNGVDDYPDMTEVTTLDHARDILAFAQDKGLGHLSMWASERDNGGCPGEGANDSCSGIEQAPWAFSKVLGAFTGS